MIEMIGEIAIGLLTIEIEEAPIEIEMTDAEASATVMIEDLMAENAHTAAMEDIHLIAIDVIERMATMRHQDSIAEIGKTEEIAIDPLMIGTEEAPTEIEMTGAEASVTVMIEDHSETETLLQGIERMERDARSLLQSHMAMIHSCLLQIGTRLLHSGFQDRKYRRQRMIDNI